MKEKGFGGSMKKQKNAAGIFIGVIQILLICFLFGCTTPKPILPVPSETSLMVTLTSTLSLASTKTPVPTPSHTATQTFTPISSETPPILTSTLTATPVLSPLADFPLDVGNYWVYHYYAYEQNISAEVTITVKVISTQMISGYFIAEMDRKNQITSGRFTLYSPPQPLPEGRFWYIVNGGRVYVQWGDTLDLTKVNKIYLEYVFPLLENPCFFRYNGMLEDFTQASPNDPNSFRGCTWVEGPVEMVTIAGTFENCSLVVTPGHAGGFAEWLCPGIGYVGDKYDHAGTPYGYETTLVDYYLSRP